MNKTIFLLMILAVGSFGEVKSQTVQIGQSAEEIKTLIEWLTKDRNKPDTYGRYSDARYSSDVLYNNGQIVEVIQCAKNQFYYDFMMHIDLCKHFVMKQGVLSYILTQYENVPIERIQKLYDETYSDTKIGDLYFDEEFEHYSKIYLATNGYATIEYKKVDNIISQNFRKEIEQKKEIVAQKQLLKKMIIRNCSYCKFST